MDGHKKKNEKIYGSWWCASTTKQQFSFRTNIFIINIYHYHSVEMRQNIYTKKNWYDIDMKF